MSDRHFCREHEYPEEGQTILLVYGECVCGYWCACAEGSVWPSCPHCGERVFPLRPAGPITGDPEDYPAKGFAATFGPEQVVLKGLEAPSRDERHYPPDELQAMSERRKAAA